MSTKITIDPPKPLEEPTKPLKGYDGPEITGRVYTSHSKPQKIGNRRIVNKPKHLPEVIEVHEAPDMEKMIHDGLAIISYELSQYRNKAEKGKTLELKEARVVTSYVEVLTKLAREARESKKPELLQHMSDEELLKLVQGSLDSANKKNVNPQSPLESSQDPGLPLESNGDLK